MKRKKGIIQYIIQKTMDRMGKQNTPNIEKANKTTCNKIQTG